LHIADERSEIAELVKINGGIYEGDLTKQITHLISFRTEGAKYKAAKSWGLRIVSIEWLRESLERGMILDEKLYDPVLPIEERGEGAWDKNKPRSRVSLSKRPRDDNMSGVDGTKRKLRRTASSKFDSQSQQIWGDIVGGGNITEVARSGVWESHNETQQQLNKPQERKPQHSFEAPADMKVAEGGIFHGCRFYFENFNPGKIEVLCSHLVPQGAEIVDSLDMLPSVSETEGTRHLLMMVPHNFHIAKHPKLPKSKIPIEIVTEWWVERCLHRKRFMHPAEHIVGRPFRVFPIQEFTCMVVCSSAFSGIDLLHFKKSVELLGAQYSEDMTPRCTVLVTNSLKSLRKDKYEHSKEWKIPIVGAEWLWQCIELGKMLNPKTYRYRSQTRSGSLPDSAGRPSSRGTNHEAEAKIASVKPNARSQSPFTEAPAKPPSPELNTSALFTADEEQQVKDELDSSTLQLETEPLALTKDPPDLSQPLSERNLNSSSKTVSTAPAPSGHPFVRSPPEDISNAISDLLARSKTAPLHSEAPKERKRSTNRILGRVTSNLSTTSSLSRATSVDSTATHGNCVEFPHNSGKEPLSIFSNEDWNPHKDEDCQPPGTQLQYEDPESNEIAERVMAKMLGEKPPPRKRTKEKAVTIGDFELPRNKPRVRPTRGALR
jgi:DNA replication regulator DPB11